ncbi:hypothetical protein Q3G72_005951 [Acer saccharum]|nr:hypothetical protein Q3G72_005951 [Acer saccharum]
MQNSFFSVFSHTLSSQISQTMQMQLQGRTSAASMRAGFMFCPTDDPLLLDYLRSYHTVVGIPLPFERIVVNCDLYGSKKPWEIWDEYTDKRLNCDQDLYVFIKMKKINPNGSRILRKFFESKDKCEGETKPMEVRGKLIGVVKKFRYKEKHVSNKHDAHWPMHEYSLDSSLLPHEKYAIRVICRIRAISCSVVSKFNFF